ncbi:MAG: VCBS repeat-containing protein, partial [Deltaproteobacteria bacterium]|nr:VCBS repeat-containing protein [Deltaproteobacteria bacterium]
MNRARSPDQIPLAELAAGDIDGDGIVEIIAPKRRDASGYHLIAFEHTGEQKWVSTSSTITVPGIDISPGAFSIANLDGEGLPEIVTAGRKSASPGRPSMPCSEETASSYGRRTSSIFRRASRVPRPSTSTST